MWLICVSVFITFEVISVKCKLPDEASFEVTTKARVAVPALGVRDLRWPSGIVSYLFDNSSYDYLVADRVRLAMNSIEESSCVRFKEISQPSSNDHWIYITNKARIRHCTHETASNSTAGNGLQIVMTMGLDCLQRREILHLLMHALGFKDEVTHPQRDQYVRILWNNIHPAYRPLFRIDHDDFPTKNMEYDPMSIMHFHDRAFTKNGQATIASLVPGLVISPSRELSPLDKMKLRLMFGHECNRREVDDLLDTCKNAMKGHPEFNPVRYDDYGLNPRSIDEPTDDGELDKISIEDVKYEKGDSEDYVEPKKQ